MLQIFALHVKENEVCCIYRGIGKTQIFPLFKGVRWFYVFLCFCFVRNVFPLINNPVD